MFQGIEPRRVLDVVTGVLGRELVQELLVVLLELLDTLRPLERLVPPEEAEERVRPEGVDRVVELGVVVGPLADGDLVGRPAEVADH